MSDVTNVADQWSRAFKGYVPEGAGPDTHLFRAGLDLRYMIGWAAGVTEGSSNPQRNAALAELQAVEADVKAAAERLEHARQLAAEYLSSIAATPLIET